MSLINDALKRAKQSRKEAPAIGMELPPLRPADPSPQPGLWPFLVIPLVLAVVLALAGVFLWRWIDQNKYQPVVMTTKPIVEPSPPVTPTSQSPLPTKTAPSTDLAVIPPAATNLTATPATNAISNLTVTATEPPPPPPLKLQGIFYSRKDPTAVINGKIRRVGDRIGDARLVAIEPESVTVEVAGKTSELALP